MIINVNKKLFNKKYIDLISVAYEYAIKYLKVPYKNLEVNIDFVNSKKIRQLNSDFRSTDKVTDVLSFPNLLEVGKKDMQLIVDKLTKENFKMEINPENQAIFLGDICICKKVALKQAREYGNTKAREIVYMAVHGLLHLLGYDHIKEEDKVIMREVEEKIMSHINLSRE